MLIPVDAARFAAMFSGNVTPAREWTERPDGSRTRSDVQATNDQNVPMWEVEIVYSDTVFGQAKTEAAPVLVPASTEPKPSPFTPARFEGLTVNAYGTKTGMRTSFSAAGLAAAAPAQPQGERRG